MKIDAAPLALNPAQGGPEAARQLRQAAEGFEALFLDQLMKAARQNSLGEDLMGSSAVDSTRAMLDTEISRLASGRAGLGIADAVERQFRPILDRMG